MNCCRPVMGALWQAPNVPTRRHANPRANNLTIDRSKRVGVAARVATPAPRVGQCLTVEAPLPSPWLSAQMAAWVRFDTPSLRVIAFMCTFTVPSVI